MQESFILEGCRTAIGSLRGALSGVRADNLAAFTMSSVLSKCGIEGGHVDEVLFGCANQSGEDNRNVARMSLLLAGIPFTVPGETVNRLCASGMSAVVHASRMISVGDADLVLAGGVEHMTRAPWVMSKSASPFGSDVQLFDSTFGWRFVNPEMKRLYGVDSMGNTAENLAQKYHIPREDQDKFAFSSQQKASKAQQAGRFAKEISAMEVPEGKKGFRTFDQDEFIKPGTTVERLNELKPAFHPDGTVTAGNASGLNDGAAALLVASGSFIQAHDLSPLCRIVSSATAGVEPRIMGIGPVEASLKALKKAQITLDQIDVIEINEAFAVQVLACTRALGLDDEDSRLNPNGGSIALGHPLGMSGARILFTAALELALTHKRYALVTMCVGVGQGYAVILENCFSSKFRNE